MYKINFLFLFLFISLMSYAQLNNYNPYLPTNNTLDLKFSSQVYYNSHLNSNGLTNGFLNTLNKSEYISDELKNKQYEQLNGHVLSSQNMIAGADFWINSRDENRFSYYIGFDHQQVLDSKIDADIIGLLFYGNKKYAGENLDINNTHLYNTYFNRLKVGGGIDFGDDKITHTITGALSIILGQNYEDLIIHQSDLYTHQDGEYIDLSIQADIELADTSWANIWTINGIGSSVDLTYSLIKENNYHLAFSIKNLGFINWHKASFSGSVDTGFRFEGIQNDNHQNQSVPDNYAFDNLRNIIFKDAKEEAFTKMLPMDIHITGGKYFSNSKFYAGISAVFYPTLHRTSLAKLFFTWNHKDKFHITPIMAYNSLGQLTAGMAIGVNISKSVFIRAGSSYLTSFFNSEAPAAQGGFISLVFVK